MEYITTKEASAKWGISTSRITLLANEGRIPGAQRLGKNWLIPSSATKPAEMKPNHSKSSKKDTDIFSFPLYHFRPDWCYIKDTKLSEQQQLLLQAETAVLECRFEDVYPILEPVMQTPDNIVTEIGCLWNIGMSNILLNKPDEFFKIFLRLQLLLEDEFPHRTDMVVVFDFLKTYIETVSSTVSNDNYNINIHEQCLPLTSMLIAYSQLIKETITLGAANTTMLELMLRFLQTTSATVTIEMVHLYLMGIYFIRQDIASAQKHAKIAVQIAYENKLYLPLVTYYRYSTMVLTPIIAKYPKDFQDHCHNLFAQYETNFKGFLFSINKDAVLSKLSTQDFPYICAVSMGLTNANIAEKLNVSPQTVLYRLGKLCDKLGVKNKKEMKEYIHKYL